MNTLRRFLRSILGGQCCTGEHNGFGVQCDAICECTECVEQHADL